jgi:hypothetical protein
MINIYENLYFEAKFFKILEYIFKNDNLTTCKLCFTSIILHANFKQKPKSVLQKKKKEKEEFKRTTMRDYLERKWVESSSMRSPIHAKICTPCSRILKLKLLGIGFSRSRAWNNGQESTKSHPKTTKKIRSGEKIKRKEGERGMENSRWLGFGWRWRTHSGVAGSWVVDSGGLMVGLRRGDGERERGKNLGGKWFGKKKWA